MATMLASMVSHAELMTPDTRPLTDFDPAAVSAVALKAFFNLADAWQLSNEEMMTLLRGHSALTF